MKNIYQIKVVFSPNCKFSFDNGGSKLDSDEYFTSMYVTADSLKFATQKFNDYIKVIAKSYEFTSKVKTVPGIDYSPMDGKIIRCRNEEHKLAYGSVILGWLP